MNLTRGCFIVFILGGGRDLGFAYYPFVVVCVYLLVFFFVCGFFTHTL